jgi:hypothetical protein
LEILVQIYTRKKKFQKIPQFLGFKHGLFYLFIILMILFEWAIKTFKQLLGNLKITYFPPSSQLGKLAVTCLGKPQGTCINSG